MIYGQAIPLSLHRLFMRFLGRLFFSLECPPLLSQSALGPFGLFALLSGLTLPFSARCFQCLGNLLFCRLIPVLELDAMAFFDRFQPLLSRAVLFSLRFSQVADFGQG